GDLLIRRPGHRRLLRVNVDAPGALRDLRDAERYQLLHLRGNRAVLERLVIEVEERPIRLGHELAHLLELRSHVDAVKLHGVLPDGRMSGANARARAISGRGTWAGAFRARPCGPAPCPR